MRQDKCKLTLQHPQAPRAHFFHLVPAPAPTRACPRPIIQPERVGNVGNERERVATRPAACPGTRRPVPAGGARHEGLPVREARGAVLVPAVPARVRAARKRVEGFVALVACCAASALAVVAEEARWVTNRMTLILVDGPILHRQPVGAQARGTL